MILTDTQAAKRSGCFTDDERRLFYPASILTPERAAATATKQPERVRALFEGKWFLCGDLSAAMFDVVKSDFPSDLSIRVTAFASPIGVYYGVVSHQMRGHAHRFVLPLFEAAAGELLTAIQKHPLMFMWGRDEQEEAMVLPCPLPGRDFAPLLGLCRQPTGEQLRDAVSEVPNVISVMKTPAQVPSCVRGQEIVNVDVSVLLPTESLKVLLGLAQGQEK
jgi:hypothetical protein